jgi:D-3-phosphoglycerate dehydrogenase
MAKAYVTRVIPRPGIDLLAQHLDVDVNESDEPLSHDALCQKASQYDALVTLLTDRVDREVFESGRGNLRIVANVAVGYDNIDVAAATDAGILVSNTPGVLTETTADFAFALLMATARRIPEGDAFFRAGKYHGWGILMLLGEDIHGKTLGLVGFGRIGQAVAKRATGFGMTILYYDPVVQADEFAASVGARRTDLETLLRESDFVSLHTPLVPETHHLIGAEELGMMKPTACLINTSRGPVLDEGALVEALRARTIWAAGLDVYEREPEAAPGLVDLPNTVLTPHIASASRETRTRMATTAADNVIALFDGRRPATLVNPEAYRS